MHAHDTGVRAHTCLHGLFSVEHSYQPGTFQCTSSCNNTLRCRWVPSRTIKLRVAWEVMGNTRPVRANTADRAARMLTTQGYVRILVCTVCFQWNIHTNREHSSAHRVATTHYGAGRYPQETTNYELPKKDWATRAPYAQTLQTVRQTCSRTTTTCAHTFVQVPFSGKVKPTRTSPMKQRLESPT